MGFKTSSTFCEALRVARVSALPFSSSTKRRPGVEILRQVSGKAALEFRRFGRKLL